MSLPSTILPDEYSATQRDISYMLSSKGITALFYRDAESSCDGYSMKIEGNPVIYINSFNEDELQHLVAYRELAFIRLGLLENRASTLEIPRDERWEALKNLIEVQMG